MTTIINQKFTKNPIENYKIVEKVINEEFKIWKKTVPFLYETIQMRVLSHSVPSCMFKWLPQVSISENMGLLEAQFLLNDAQSHEIQLCKVKLPATLSPEVSENIPIPAPGQQGTKFEVVRTFKTSGKFVQTDRSLDVNSRSGVAAYFESDANLQFLTCETGTSTSVSNLHKTLENPNVKWYHDELVTGSGNEAIVWDLSAQSSRATVYVEDSAINDFSRGSNPNIFAAAVENKNSICIFDLRDAKAPVFELTNTHNDTLTSCAMHPGISSLLATGSKDKIISLWDLRYFERPFRNLFGVKGEIKDLKFDKNQSNVLTSSALDRRVYVWDLNEIEAGDFDEEIYEKDPENEDPCLKFIHGGHLSQINGYDLHPSLVNLYGSVDNGNLLEIWKPFFEEAKEDSKDE